MNQATSLNLPILLILIMVTCGVALVVKWIRLPYAICLVLVGLLIGLFHLLPPVTMTPDLILVIFLPSILFEASWNFNLKALKESFKPIFAFATLGVVISSVMIALVLRHLIGMDIVTGLMFGAMVSATDPISVLALFKRLGVDRRLTTILEGESLFNDGTALVLFRIFLAAAVAGAPISLMHMGAEFLIVTLGGTALGIAIGYACSLLTQAFDDHLLEITLTVLLAYGAYLLSEQLHVSSVICCLIAGMVMGNFGSKIAMSASTRLAVNAFWEYAAFLAESLVFLLIGMQIRLELFVKYAPMVGAAIVAILLSRLVVVYGIAPFVSSKKRPLPLPWCHLLFWGGLRGSLCMAMALSLPESFPAREQIIVMAFGVAAFTLFVQGLTVEPLVRLLKVGYKYLGVPKYLSLQSDLKQCDAEMKKLTDSFAAQKILKRDYLEKKTSIEIRKHELSTLIDQLKEGNASIEEVENIQIETALLAAQMDCLDNLSRGRKVSDSVIDGVRIKLNEQLVALKVEGSTVSRKKLDNDDNRLLAQNEDSVV